MTRYGVAEWDAETIFQNFKALFAIQQNHG